MNTRILSKGKKLSKKELKTVNGGLGTVRCTTSTGYCKYIGPGCQEEKCQLPVPIEAIDPVEGGHL
ncbi:bacteriocin [Chryseobacterium pennipullorum]|uniref:Bacteriocin-type signal sequence-containing protein n=1 Tax=Chryseobacterium pennipullorum TaxID=2258963 RepID=A0A3D9BA09_9FLAO|nr:bacteriocin [Chryseobacterium pennipullorum]REC50158.1 hypothetical protein DRF67_01080 [Chryseobacterium pennipullorum]